MAARFGDVLNLWAGLWLVPKHAAGDLGSIKPLEAIAGLVGVPISIMVFPCVKALNKHMLLGEAGKAKALMRDMFLFCAAVLALTVAAATIALPWILQRWNIENGRLALAIIISAALGALLPVFTGVIQAMKKFNVYSVAVLVGPPLRFVTLLLLLPFRGLTGYFTGQSVQNLVGVGASVWIFFRDFGRKVRAESYWRDDRAIFAACLLPLTLSALAGSFRGTAEATMLKWIPETQSAAFYILTRFTDIVAYTIVPLTFVLLPVFSERHETGTDSGRTLLRGMFFCVAVGTALGAVFTLFGPQLLGLSEYWSPYTEYSNLFWLLSFTSGLRFAFTCFSLRELAALRFKYIWFGLPVNFAGGLAIWALGRSQYFGAHIGLREVLYIQLVLPVIFFIYAVTVLILRKKRDGKF